MRHVATSPAPSRLRNGVDALLLPGLQERVRECLWFLAISQTLYILVLPFSHDTDVGVRAALCIARLVGLYGCLFALRQPADRTWTLTVAGASLFVQFGVGVAMSAVREDVLPMALLTIALTYLAAARIPWGARSQAMLAAGATAALAAASAIVYRLNGTHLGFDPLATLVTGYAVSVYIAYALERSRERLRERLEEARRTDEELAVLHAQLEKRVAERTAELEMANRELESFSYTVSHDLRSPLRTIAGFSQMILDERGDVLDESVHSHLGKIRGASRRMDGLIDDMLRLSRVSRSTLRYEPVSLSAVAREIGTELSAEEPHRDVELRVDDIPTVPGDLSLLRIAMENLLRNAWKFTGTRGRAHVAVSGRIEGDELVAAVEDDGIGFDPRFRGKLFHPFERIHDVSEFPGSGVGLATVARIVRRHGGSVDASGSVDGGATFVLRLPLTRSTSAGA